MSGFLWKIPQRNVCCSRGRESLVKRNEYFSLLLPAKKQGMIRKDFCPTCWNEGAVLNDYPDLLAHWHVQKQTRPILHPTTEKIERMVERLQSLLEEEIADSFQKAFLIAQYLVRHRRIALRRLGNVLQEAVYEDLVTEAIFTIPFVPLGKKEKEEWVARIEREIRGQR